MERSLSLWGEEPCLRDEDDNDAASSDLDKELNEEQEGQQARGMGITKRISIESDTLQ